MRLVRVALAVAVCLFCAPWMSACTAQGATEKGAVKAEKPAAAKGPRTWRTLGKGAKVLKLYEVRAAAAAPAGSEVVLLRLSEQVYEGDFKPDPKKWINDHNLFPGGVREVKLTEHRRNKSVPHDDWALWILHEPNCSASVDAAEAAVF